MRDIRNSKETEESELIEEFKMTDEVNSESIEDGTENKKDDDLDRDNSLMF